MVQICKLAVKQNLGDRLKARPVQGVLCMSSAKHDNTGASQYDVNTSCLRSWWCGITMFAAGSIVAFWTLTDAIISAHSTVTTRRMTRLD